MLPFELTKDTPYLALSGELWSVFYEYFNRNWPCYKGFLLYYQVCHNVDLSSWCEHDRVIYIQIKPKGFDGKYESSPYARIWTMLSPF